MKKIADCELRNSGERTRLACCVRRPRGTNPEVEDVEPDGEGAAGSTRGRVRSPERARTALIFTSSIIAAISIAWLVLPRPPLLDGIPFSQCARDRDGQILRVGLTDDQKYRIRVPLRDISPDLIQATLRYEDKYYAKHPGVNPVALMRSAWNLVSGGTRTGGSTITMQLARLRFHLQTRSLSGKLKQIVRALEIERHYSKEQILEAYLNLAPYGRNIEGAGAAAQIYFNKTPAHLTAPEAVALSVIPQSPGRRALSAERANGSVNAAQNRYYDRTGASDEGFSARQFEARALQQSRKIAPHFVQQVMATNKNETDITTTLHREIQEIVEQRVADYIVANRNRGIRNAAVLLVETKSMDVLAQVGSADFTNVEINGQVDGTRAARSPGSTLKPFVYALAMEQGLIHPLTMVTDAPRSFGDYNPENFDREFLGPIRASDALARSRNIPAVTLTSQLARPTLYQFLRRAEVKLARSESSYGLALPLGGAEVTMQDLVRLYATLANNGELRPLRCVSTDPVNQGRRILSPEAAFLTLEMLGNVPRPEMSCANGSDIDPVFWKTGTSHGFHDAWSIAVFDHYVLAVWIGNFDGKPNNEFVGRSAAAPLLFQVIDSLRARFPDPHTQHPPPAGANLKRVEFCAVSGDMPGPFCTQRVEGWFIPGISPIRTCNIHREVLVDAASGLRVPADDGTRVLRRDVYEFWPSDLLALFRRAGVPRKTPPPFLPGHSPDVLDRQGEAPRIVAPAAGAKREIILAAMRDEGIPLRAKTEADVREVYWFADKTFIGKARPADSFAWKSAPGHYELTVLDDHGRSGNCTVRIR